MLKWLYVLFFISFFINVNAQFSDEVLNPYNEFSREQHGVNLYSGDVSLPQHLYTIDGRNGMDINISLHYSSNVYLNVIAENDKAPTGWVGLGWRTKMGGKIYADHHNTMPLSDDKYYYVSPKGIKQRILEKDGKFFLEKDLYWKVIREVQTGSETKRIKGWTLIDPTGMIYRYGDMINHTQAGVIRNATRYTFCWDDEAASGNMWVGTGFTGTPELYAFQWDLAEAEDLGGNKITYDYWQDKKATKYKTWILTFSLSHTEIRSNYQVVTDLKLSKED